MSLMTMVPTTLTQIISKEIIAKENSSPLKDHYQVFLTNRIPLGLNRCWCRMVWFTNIHCQQNNRVIITPEHSSGLDHGGPTTPSSVQVNHSNLRMQTKTNRPFSNKRRFLAHGMGTKNSNNCCPLPSGRKRTNQMWSLLAIW